jgi:hypothetical protein
VKGKHDQRRRHGEGKPSRKPAQKSVAPQDAQGKTDLARGRSWQELAERDKVSIGGVVQPFAPNDEFIAVISEMRDRTAKRAHAQLEKGEKNLTNGSSIRSRIIHPMPPACSQPESVGIERAELAHGISQDPAAWRFRPRSSPTQVI